MIIETLNTESETLVNSARSNEFRTKENSSVMATSVDLIFKSNWIK